MMHSATSRLLILRGLEKTGIWKGNRNGIQIEMEQVNQCVQWKAAFKIHTAPAGKTKVTTRISNGTSPTVTEALQAINLEHSRLVALAYEETRKPA